MIIHRLNTKNIFAYEQLDLLDLPEKGIIAISGLDNGGKSAIGNTICFALFGRTFSYKDKELDKIIHWGKKECSVTIRFSNDKIGEENGELYAITRTLDAHLNHSAKLYKVYYEENVIAEGVEEVEKAFYELTSINYEEFTQSFCLRQNQLTTFSQSSALKKMAGMATLEQCYSDVRNELDQLDDELDELKQKNIHLDNEFSEIDFDEGHIKTLKIQQDKTLKDKIKIEKIHKAYFDSVEQYQQITSHENFYKKNKSPPYLIFSVLFLCLVSLIVLAFWWQKTAEAEQIIQLQASHFFQLVAEKLIAIQSFFTRFGLDSPYSYSIISGLFVLLLILLLVRIRHKKKSDAQQLSGMILAEQMHLLDSYREEKANKKRHTLIKNISLYQVTEKEFITMTKADLFFLTLQNEQQLKKIEENSTALSIEFERIQRVTQIQKNRQLLGKQILKSEEQKSRYELAIELLISASKRLSINFNQFIRERIDEILPLLTDNCYQSLQIDEAFQVQLFTRENQEFINLEETSSEIQQQVALAVYLAFSQEVINQNVHNQQMIILDEPFSFINEEKIKKLLLVLPKLNHKLAQFWIMSQTFPDKIEFDYKIHCE
jgi:DNA repair protein SbcC/Rad50